MLHPPNLSHLDPCTQTTKPQLATQQHPNQNSSTHVLSIKPKYCPLIHPVTSRENNKYLCARTCDSGSGITLVLLEPNTQPYTDNYGLNHYQPTPTTILYISPPTFFSTNSTFNKPPQT